MADDSLEYPKASLPDSCELDNKVYVDLARLNRPSMPKDFVPRPLLSECLNDNVHKALTLVCAGAGFGKSTLISGWLESSSLQYAWVSLQEDYDPRLFFVHMITAVQQSVPGFGKIILPLLQMSSLPPVKYLATELKNEFSKLQSNFVLVLDDMHFVSAPDIFKFLQVLLNPPLDTLHVCIISRKEPQLRLSKLRVQNGINEIRTNQLRMTREEIDCFLDKSSATPVEQPIRALIRERSEGWIAGLRLFKLQISSGQGNKGLLNMGGQIGQFFDSYFLEEILSGFSDICIDSILKMSVLSRFNPDLADALVGEADAGCHAHDLINRLLDENIFIIVVDAENQWYRFHHLFHDLLRKEMKKRFTKLEQKELHEKAARWYGEKGIVNEALFYAEKIENYDLAASLVVANFYRALEHDHDYMLESWLKLLPEELINKTPVLLIIRMWVLKDREAFHVLPGILEQLKAMQTQLDGELQAQIHFFEGIVQYWGGTIDLAAISFKKTLNGLPLRKYVGILGECEVYHITAMQMQGKGDAVAADIEKRLLGKNLPNHYVLKLLAALIFKHLISGNLDMVIRLAERTRNTEKQATRNPFIIAWVDYILGSVYFRQNKFDEAELYLEQTLKSRYIMDLVSPVDCFAAQLFVLQARGKTNAFKETLQQFREFVRERNNPYFHIWLYSMQTRLALQKKDVAMAEEYFKKVEIPAGEHNFLIWVEDPRITYCRLLLARNTVEALAEADGLLGHYRKIVEELHHTLLKIEVYILCAVLEVRRNSNKAAISYLEKAITLAEQGNVIQLFLEVADDIISIIQIMCLTTASGDFVHKLSEEINAWQNTRSTTSTTHVLNVCEKLTNREMDVITLLAQRMTNQEIADKLSISVATVKRHTVTIYQKLQAKNRREAVIIAVRDGILSL